MRYKNKLQWIRRYTKNKKILYIGSLDNDTENIDKHLYLQKSIEQNSHRILGVYQSNFIEDKKLSSRTIIGVDIDTMDLGDNFDTILCADNFEHLANYGTFLCTISRHLREEGVFLVSSPNPISLVRILELLLLGSVNANPEHTCWFTKQVFDQLIRRYGFKVVHEVFIDDMYQYHTISNYRLKYGRIGPLLRFALFSLNRMVCSCLPRFSETTGYVIKKVKS